MSQERFQTYLNELCDSLLKIGKKHGYILMTMAPRRLRAGNSSDMMFIAGDLKAGGFSALGREFLYPLSQGNVDSYNKALKELEMAADDYFE